MTKWLLTELITLESNVAVVVSKLAKTVYCVCYTVEVILLVVVLSGQQQQQLKASV